jgi:hypothetical protein
MPLLNNSKKYKSRRRKNRKLFSNKRNNKNLISHTQKNRKNKNKVKSFIGGTGYNVSDIIELKNELEKFPREDGGDGIIVEKFPREDGGDGIIVEIQKRIPLVIPKLEIILQLFDTVQRDQHVSISREQKLYQDTLVNVLKIHAELIKTMFASYSSYISNEPKSENYKELLLANINKIPDELDKYARTILMLAEVFRENYRLEISKEFTQAKPLGDDVHYRVVDN